MPLFFFLNLFFVYCYFFGGLSPPFYAPVPSNQMQRVAGSCYSMECLPPPIRFYYEVLPPFFSFLACCLPFCSRNNCQWQLLRTCKLGCSRKTERRTAALYWQKPPGPHYGSSDGRKDIYMELTLTHININVYTTDGGILYDTYSVCICHSKQSKSSTKRLWYCSVTLSGGQFVF